MHRSQAQYHIYGYLRGGGSFAFTQTVDGPADVEMIANARDLIAPDTRMVPGDLCYADLFYCQGKDVKLVGTWVVSPGRSDQPEAVWHSGGWVDRPKPSKEAALRFLQGLDRPI